MLLSHLLEDIVVLNSFEDREITDVTDKTANVKEGCAFVCITGARFDGHSVAEDMIKQGARAVIVTRDLGLKEQIIVENTREAYAIMCKNLFDRSADKLKIIGITGTNGKTTTAFVIKDILKELGVQSGLIGTVKNMVGDKDFHTELTTPDPYDMHALFKMMVDDGIEYCVMETSSQAFHQMRLAGIHFVVGAFTNLTQDHLDYHGTLDEYKKCKKNLFLNCDKAIFNNDDEASAFMRQGIKAPATDYSINESSSYKAENVQLFSDRVEYDLNGQRVVFHIPGGFSVYNSLTAISVVNNLGYALEDVIKAAFNAKSVSGRVEVLKTNTDFSVIIDYAHSPDGLEKAINAVRGFTKGRVITLFGCGGDRDKTKRPKMGKIAAELSDIVVVTSDNPRTEDPEEIIKDILQGIDAENKEIITITDRSDAIRKAISIAKKDDAILLAGKGHETYQVIGKERVHYDEREVVADILK
ncbi:MAG: UDP-N-acetylmuramoyl-L-alanyl-D-glutamate--2,6-diaminopimelate ligase [Clostridia bacterium]|nr:UDP-N-acetylmuramoyl-L-alanyl-D-glutamate--2,6-diaminopimelate ligase [Clostridia bacterium]